ncbi:ketol-acid reductoisomerase [Buchnera aphidicola (Ceratoglyphina bambusae)]|uniref:ketol-acid reductoisomerase n=1 Tax=Buchnera aphidicola TaxID=9 RepID=UPI0031B8364D
MKNYFSSLNFRNKLKELRKCRLLKKKEFNNKVNILINKKIVIIGCGSQGLNQGLNLRDSGLNVCYALQKSSINKKNLSWKNAINNNFKVGTYKELIPNADLIINLTPDKQHSIVINKIEKFIKKNAVLGYSHGFNIVEYGQKIRKDITVIMVAPKCPGTEVREEYKRGFGVPALIAVHSKNDNRNIGLDFAKAWAYGLGSSKAGVLESSFSAEVKSDLMGEQTILCGILQSASIVYYNKLISQNFNKEYSCKLVQNGWEVITESLKHGGITLMLDRLSNSSKIKAYKISEKLKVLLKPLFKEHMDNIISGDFSRDMIKDWNNGDKKLLHYRNISRKSEFENSNKSEVKISEEEYFENCIFIVSILKAGIELSYEIMLESGICSESAYYESLHEIPLIANTISRKKLYEMNLVISDTAEYGNYIFSNKAIPILENFINKLDCNCLFNSKNLNKNIDNIELSRINQKIRNHSIEKVGYNLRKYMVGMKSISFK